MNAFTHFSSIKPLIPRRIQILIRRILINYKLPRYKHVWPIDPESVKPPEGWAGWPEGKKFALVLTHDIDTPKGHDRCHILAELEERLGFRSSFNFVAEDYGESSELLTYLKKRGFEVGQHGIKHKNPFLTKRHFKKQSLKINNYLKEWQAVGFRSPGMFHNLEWVHELEIEYDASTFDTDPFEPQPDGTGTIFPFWVSNNSGRKGYVELPYTLAQDFLLFILMKKQYLDIWKKKLDWIAEHGGMALLITHPDYMNFDRNPNYIEEYPARYYVEFLDYIKSKYDDQYWHVLPKDLARWWAKYYS